MLPEGFQWRPYSGGPGLYCGDRLVAHACEASAGNGWRMSLDGSGGPGRYVFLPDEAACRRYAEAWALKWADEIREFGMVPPSLGAGSGPRSRSDEPVQSRHPRGGKARRHGPLG
jgi:hypothetical protein